MGSAINATSTQIASLARNGAASFAAATAAPWTPPAAAALAILAALTMHLAVSMPLC